MTQNGNGQDKALEIWGDRTAIRDIAGRCEQMIPGIIKLPASLRPAASLAMAQISVMAGLNPFIGELWPIPQKSSKGGPVDGFQIMVGVKGLRRVAKVQAKDLGLIPPYYRPDWRWPTEEEKEAMALKPGDTAIICVLELFLPPDHPFYRNPDAGRYTVEGIGLVRSNYYGKMEPIQAARKRAESDALKMAFDIPLGGTVMDAEYEATDWIEVGPASEIPALINKVDPDNWDNAVAMLKADGIIKDAQEIVDALTDLRVTYLDDENFTRIMGLVCQNIERQAEIRDHCNRPMPSGMNLEELEAKRQAEVDGLFGKSPLPREPMGDRKAGAQAAQDAIFGAPGRAKAQAGSPAAQTSQRPLEGVGGAVVRNGEVVRSTRRDPGDPPWDPDQVLAYLQDVAKSARDQSAAITDKQKALLSRKGRELYAGTGDEDLKYHSLLMWAFGVSSTGNLTKAQGGALLDWALDGDRGPDGDYQLQASAPEEAQRILRAKMEEAGQQDMFNKGTR